MGKRGAIVLTVVGVLLAVAAGGGLWWRHTSQERERDDASRAVVRALAAAWQARDLDVPGLRFRGATADSIATQFASVTGGLGAGPVKVGVGTVRRSGGRASAQLDVAWTLPGGSLWSYRVPVEVAQSEHGWEVQPPATGSLWHPQVAPEETLTATRAFGPRGDLLDRDGRPLMPMGKVYPVQLDPARASTATATALEKLVGEPAGSLVAKLETAQDAGSRAPIPVITYRADDFEERRTRLDALVGVIYPAREQPLGRTRTFGQPLLGSFGPVTAELVERSEGRYAAGDLAGLSGLQGQYDRVLAGTAGVTVTSSARPDAPLFERAPEPGQDVTVTLDPGIQEVAEAALAATGDVPSALVAVDVPTGDLVAVANHPAFGFDRALTGQYPPGSAFKVATTYSLLSQGRITPDTEVSCPRTTVVDGRSYRNYEGESLGSPDFATVFAHSCNTAFVQLAEQLADDDLSGAAKALGIGAGWAQGLGVSGAFDGSVPTNNGKTDKASAAIGQGRNLASPAALAVMTGSVARGSHLPPALVTGPAPEGLRRDAQPLDPEVVGQLQDLMRQVVTDGTGTALAQTPGGPVHGKTGTAEHGTKIPPDTHAWFVGYQGGIAFAVLVESGRSGGTVAAPVAGDLLTRLAER